MTGSSTSTAAAYAIRFVITPREYEVLARKWKLSATLAPQEVHDSERRQHVPQQLVRQHARLFLKFYGVAKLIAFAIDRRMPGLGSIVPAADFAGSITLLSAGYRLLYAVLARAVQLRYDGKDAKTAHDLLVPAAAAVLASSAFALFPEMARNYLALYVATKAAEFVYNYFDDAGYLKWKPRFLGSWLLFPIATSQLFHTLIVDPKHSPGSFTRIMMRLRGSYGPYKPVGYPRGQRWPKDRHWLRSIADVALLRFPRFRSHEVFRKQRPYPEVLKAVVPVLELAHPGNTTYTGAILHPAYDSEWQPFLETVLSGYGSTLKWLVPLYFLFALRRNHGDVSPQLLSSVVANTLRTATFITMFSATSWAGIGLSQSLLGTKALLLTRFRIIGFMSGLWAFLDQVNGRTRNLFALRLAILSQYNSFAASRGGTLVPNGDLLLFGAAFTVIAVLFNKAPEAISSPGLRKILNWIQRGDYIDPAPLPDLKSEERQDKQ